MKKLLAITLSLFSVSALAFERGLDSDLVEQAVAAGLTTDEAVYAVATGKIRKGMSEEMMLEVGKDEQPEQKTEQ